MQCQGSSATDRRKLMNIHHNMYQCIHIHTYIHKYNSKSSAVIQVGKFIRNKKRHFSEQNVNIRRAHTTSSRHAACRRYVHSSAQAAAATAAAANPDEVLSRERKTSNSRCAQHTGVTAGRKYQPACLSVNCYRQFGSYFGCQDAVGVTVTVTPAA